MADNDYKLLHEDAGQDRSMDTNMYKNGGFDSPMGMEGGRTPPPPYGMNMTPQPYGMVSSPVNPMMMQQTPQYQQGVMGAPQQPEISPPQPQVIHVVSQPQQIAGPTSVGQDPVRIQCPSCRVFIKSRVDRKSICKTHMCACLLFFCLCWPCVCIPYCSSGCRDANHSCPNCGAFLGTYKA